MTARRAAVCVVWLAGACTKEPPREQKAPIEPAPRPSVSVEPPRPVPIALAKIPGLVNEPRDGALRDCRLSTVLRARFGNEVVEPCGALEIEASPAVMEASRRCVARAVAAGKPFVYEQKIQGTDSGVELGVVGVIEHGQLVTYSAHFDSDPCGGDCSDRGHTTLSRCKTLSVTVDLASCRGYAADCYECRDSTQLADCVYGKKR